MELLNSNIKTKKKENNSTKKKELEKSQNEKSKSKNKSRSRSRSRSRSQDKNKEKNSEKKISILKSSINISENQKYPDFPLDENKLFKIIHWNVNGIIPLLKTKELDNLIKEEDPDIICFNEIKIDKELIKKINLTKIINKQYKQYKSYWYCPEEKIGYSGTGILTKYEPLSVSYGMNIEKHDKEGRIITLEFEKFYLICCYTPNSGQALKRLNYRINEWDKNFFEFINSLKLKKDIILTGDLNVCRGNLDIFDPKGREKLAGFTQVEKESFIKFLKMGYIDTFRDLHPKEQKYTFFSNRGGNKAKEVNKGWRLDYFIINENAKYIKVKESTMTDKDKYNSSDHIPIRLTFYCKE